MSVSGEARPRLDTMRTQSSVEAWPRPVSPSFSTTTTGSKVNLPASHALITRKDLRASIACLEELVAAAKAYRNALLAMSTATAAFANAMEACSRVKGCRSSNAGIAGASGLQYLISNHEQILADTVYRQFEIPLLEALDHYKLVTADRLVGYEKALTEQSGRIRKTEAENLKVGRRRKRDLQSFRQALAELQKQVDELDAVKASYHEEVLEGEDEVWETVLGKVAFVVRSQLDFYEKIAGKTSDPVLEPLVMSIPDPFNSYGPPKEENQIFSVLSPLGMLDSIPQSPTPNLTRTGSLAAIATPDRLSPMKSVPFFTTPRSPSAAETTAISAIGQHGLKSEGEGEDSRAKRELSVIEESSSIGVRDVDDDGSTGKDPQEDVQVSEAPQVDVQDVSSPEVEDARDLAGQDKDGNAHAGHTSAETITDLGHSG